MKFQTKKQAYINIVLIALVIVLIIGAVVTAVVLLPRESESKDDGKPKILEIVASDLPKREYYIGESFDATGLVIQVVTDNIDSTYFVKYPNRELIITGFDSSVPNEALPITVTYQGFSLTFPVKIKEVETPAPTLVEIKLSDNFCRSYSLDWWTKKGPIFDGVELICIFSDGSEERIPMDSKYCDKINYDIDGSTTIELTFKYSVAGVLVQGSETVTITE